MSKLIDLDSIAKDLEPLVNEIELRDQELRKDVIEFGKKFIEFYRRGTICVSIDDFILEEGEDEIYGHLTVTPDSFYLAYRTRDDDAQDMSNGVPPEFRLYSMSYPESWPIEWLRVAASQGNLNKLRESFKRQVEAILDQGVDPSDKTSQGSDVSVAVATQSHIESHLIDAAKVIDALKIAEDWGRAQRKVLKEPDGAITAACVLVETTLKHLLAHLNEPLPADKSILPLYRTLAKKLHLVPDGGEEGALRGFLSGLHTTIQNLGVLRTSMGDSHGRTPHQRRGNIDEARLAVDVAGAISSFLIRQINNPIRERSTISPTSEQDSPSEGSQGSSTSRTSSPPPPPAPPKEAPP
jgi:hypothetical protein